MCGTVRASVWGTFFRPEFDSSASVEVDRALKVWYCEEIGRFAMDRRNLNSLSLFVLPMTHKIFSVINQDIPLAKNLPIKK